MSTHKCDRETCPPINANGPKMKCIKCNKVCFLKCFGIDLDNTMNSIKIKLPNCVFWIELATSQFNCCSFNTSSTEPLSSQQNKTNHHTTIDGNNETNDFALKNTIESEMANIKKMISELKTSSDETSVKLTEAKSFAVENNNLLKKATEDKFIPKQMSSFTRNLNANLNATPTSSLHTNSARKRTFQQTKTPNNEPKIGLKIPQPIVGTSDACLGPPVKSRRSEIINRPPKSIFDKEIWVSGLHPSVTSDDVSNYIVNNTNVTNNDDFKCTILVKKDCDMSKLSFVSFKVDVKTEHFDYFLTPSIWPKSVRVREFIKPEPVKLGAILTTQNAEHSEKHRKINEQKNEADLLTEPMEN